MEKRPRRKLTAVIYNQNGTIDLLATREILLGNPDIDSEFLEELSDSEYLEELSDEEIETIFPDEDT